MKNLLDNQQLDAVDRIVSAGVQQLQEQLNEGYNSRILLSVAARAKVEYLRYLEEGFKPYNKELSQIFRITRTGAESVIRGTDEVQLCLL